MLLLLVAAIWTPSRLNNKVTEEIASYNTEVSHGSKVETQWNRKVTLGVCLLQQQPSGWPDTKTLGWTLSFLVFTSFLPGVQHKIISQHIRDCGWDLNYVLGQDRKENMMSSGESVFSPVRHLQRLDCIYLCLHKCCCSCNCIKTLLLYLWHFLQE